jgi:hypothetical protein
MDYFCKRFIVNLLPDSIWVCAPPSDYEPRCNYFHCFFNFLHFIHFSEVNVFLTALSCNSL